MRATILRSRSRCRHHMFRPGEGAKARLPSQRWRLIIQSGLASGLVLLASCSGRAPSVDQGRLLYNANGCGSCHGSSGRGDGPLAATLDVRPANLREPAQFQRGASEVEIARILAEGVVNPQVAASHLHHNHHELAMPKFDHLSDTERRSIALYVISMQANTN